MEVYLSDEKNDKENGKNKTYETSWNGKFWKILIKELYIGDEN